MKKHPQVFFLAFVEIKSNARRIKKHVCVNRKANEAGKFACKFIVNEMNRFSTKRFGVNLWEAFECCVASEEALNLTSSNLLEFQEINSIKMKLNVTSQSIHPQPACRKDQFLLKRFFCLFSECLWFLFAFFLPPATLTSYKTSKHMKHKKLMIILFCDSTQHIARIHLENVFDVHSLYKRRWFADWDEQVCLEFMIEVRAQ